MQTDSNLQAPYFQNVCFDHFRKWCKENSNQWPSTNLIRLIDTVTSKNSLSLLRKFAIDSMISKNPFKTLELNSAKRKDWEDLLNDIKELGVALAISEGPTPLDISQPWEDQCRHRYMEEEFPPDYRWRIAILLREKEEDVKKNKEKGLCNAKTEWAHLQRTRSVAASPSTTGSSLARSGDPEPETRSANNPTHITPDLARAELALANQNRGNGFVGKPLSIIRGSFL
jgi:hypothetical protein